MKTGGLYYRAGVCDEGKVYVDECILRTIRGRYGYLVLKNEFTWVKTGFGKRATWDWAKSIHPLDRTRFRIADGVPKRYTRSKAQAIRVALWEAKLDMERYRDDPECVAEQTRDITALERRLKVEIGRSRREIRPANCRLGPSGSAAAPDTRADEEPPRP